MRLRSLQQFESRRPELQVQNFAFARQHVIFDAQTEHGLQVRIDNGVGDHAQQSRYVPPCPLSIACSVSCAM